MLSIHSFSQMANQWKSSRSDQTCSLCRFVQILLVFVSAGLVKGITDEVLREREKNSSLSSSSSPPPLVQQQTLSTSTSVNRRRTLKWKTDLSDVIPTSSVLQNDTDGVHETTRVPTMSLKGPNVDLSTAVRSVHQNEGAVDQSWTRTQGPRTSAADQRKTGDAAATGWTSQENQQNLLTPQISFPRTLEPPDAVTESAATTDPTESSYKQHYHRDHSDEDHFGGYDYAEDEDDEEEEEEEEEEEDDEYNYDDDEEDEEDDENGYYDEDYDESDSDDVLHREPDDEYEGEEEYSDMDGSDTAHQYFREGNMRLPINYTDGMMYKDYGAEYEQDYQLDLAQNHLPDTGNREIRRLAISGKSSNQIDMSLLVIYAWLGLVVIMIAITVLVFKYKQQLSTRCLQVTASCRKVRQAIGIEEGNNLLSHPLV